MWCLGFCNQMLVVVGQEFYNCFIRLTCYLSFSVENWFIVRLSGTQEERSIRWREKLGKISHDKMNNLIPRGGGPGN